MEALITAHLGRIHVEGYEQVPQDDDALYMPDPAIGADLPWDDDCGTASSSDPS